MDNLTEQTENDYTEYYGDEISPSFFYFAKYTTIYLQPVIFTVGLLGNFMSFCVFLSKSMRKISSNLYLAALSGSSYGFNLVLFFQWLEMVNVPIVHMQGFCQAIVYFGYVFSFMSVWFIVCITVENYIVTFHLSKAVVYCTVFRAKIVIGLLVLYSVLLYSGQFWTTGVVEVTENYTMCTEVAEYSQLNRIYNFWDTITTLVLPIIITTTLIVAILTQNLCNAKKIDRQDNSIYRRLSKKQKSLVRITRVLLAISLTFVLLSGPSYINKLRHLILTEMEGRRPYTLTDRILQQTFQLVYYLSSCLNIIYYLVWSHNFRKETKKMLCLKPKTSNRHYRGIELRSCTEQRNGNKPGKITEKSTNHTEKITML
ncbi:somatostatin receptor type 4-like [Mercenaria mercenaria]|uniref:somatostatin receptor type 4-like n=1 Tax=Mercenaria mercenaria TaxID=6596 RepID=UPI001E1DBF01|nr:somatostatin receptor type 4-like [Mercenaria mercenaria]